MEPLITNNGIIKFLINFPEQDFESHAEFEVREVIYSNEKDEPVVTETYIKGMIKWDGCSHITFGDDNGYLHLCGKEFFELHKQVIDAIWDKCSEKIKNWSEFDAN